MVNGYFSLNEGRASVINGCFSFIDGRATPIDCHFSLIDDSATPTNGCFTLIDGYLSMIYDDFETSLIHRFTNYDTN